MEYDELEIDWRKTRDNYFAALLSVARDLTLDDVQLMRWEYLVGIVAATHLRLTQGVPVTREYQRPLVVMTYKS